MDKAHFALLLGLAFQTFLMWRMFKDGEQAVREYSLENRELREQIWKLKEVAWKREDNG